MTFTVAIIGRPNVGKSTLFNRLTGTSHALAHDQPGVTRDRREGDGRIGPLMFRIFDTAGLDEAEEGTLAARMTEQSISALKDADVALFMIDGRAGVTSVDEHFAALLRKSGARIILVVNKAEGSAASAGLLEAYALGLGEPVGISAAHGEGMVELYDALSPFAPEEAFDADEDTEKAPEILQLAIVGRPNAGKSTLINRLLGEERLLTGPEAGITRDAIAVPFTHNGETLKLIDTAGMRKRGNIDDPVEKMAVADSLRAIQYAHVVALVMDADHPLEKQDLAIAQHVEEEGRALMLVINKWDQVKEKKEYLAEIERRLQHALPQLRGLPVVAVSGLTGAGLGAMIEAAKGLYAIWNKRVGTAELNRWLEMALDTHSPPLVNGRRIKLRYATQGKSRPPTFTFFCNLDEIPETYTRYLIGSMREQLDLPGVPIRIKLRKAMNPYAK